LLTRLLGLLVGLVGGHLIATRRQLIRALRRRKHVAGLVAREQEPTRAIAQEWQVDLTGIRGRPVVVYSSPKDDTSATIAQ